MKNKITRILYMAPLAALLFTACKKNDDDNKQPEEDLSPVQFVFTSDAHYGITRAAFQGKTNVDAHTVNAAMIAKINGLPEVTLPSDGGLNAGQKIGSIDYLFEGGDIANRMEVSAKVQTAATSWEQFKTDYLQNLTIKNKKNQKAEVLMVPGNHDVSNSIGYYATMSPLLDATSMANIYNLMFNVTTKSAANFDPKKDRINFSRDIAGVHFCFIQMWPDSSVRIWMEKDLQVVAPTTPVIIVAHDQPAVVSNHFTNPNGDHGINNTDKFDNVLDEMFKSGKTTSVADVIEQRAFVAFLKKHTNIKAYLHGHAHESKFYTYGGPDNDVALATVGADSPMKGVVSAADETKLSFHFAVLDPKTQTLTVREVLWNPEPANPSAAVKWGNMVTIKLK
ncbi:putative MPP superfamily phosphohydrolase [Chitinophaga terrae (ex Kim and Jung 2007)]|uniref:metallophosphoesterase family protein n=1 Tax=Chitinophaga terrae (ex Kim and Jung 2007) TaxID=408074 RepID=UPI00277DDA6E|nr:metallophosphoesterase [Chitinophaga terrae (ex Kim and Jung 2007)]MDQ0105343.1 putative MPP superfamily phosphohydrolase [Chitinophaga terrae (ex Kim and Jung 2007)]